jgi:hypothetical protein
MRDSVRTFVLMVGAFSASVALAQSNHLNRPSGFDTRDVAGLYSERFQLIYLGRFDELRASHDFTNVLHDVFTHSALGWSIKCAEQLAPDSPTFPVTVTTRNGYGTEISSQTRNHKIDTRFAEKIREYGLPYQGISSYQRLFERNGCDSPATRQYLDNLLRLAYGKPPVQSSRTNPR